MKPIRWLRRGLTWGSLGLAGGALIVTARHILSTPQPLQSALPGEGRIDRRGEGDIYYNVAGAERAEPVVLLHGFYSGASNYEFRRIFPRLAVDYRVYAPDWLGFGMSERPALAYTGEFYATVLASFLRETVGRPATVIAHGLAANITVRAASDDPDLFERLVLVSPRVLAGTIAAPNLGQSLVRTAQRSSLGMVPYAALATRSALRWQSTRRAARPGEGGATDDALDHIFASSHQFGGQHALLALLTGELDLPVQNAFAMLDQPALVIGGESDRPQVRQEIEDLVALNPDAQMAFIPHAGDAVYEDQPAAFVERFNTWLRIPQPRRQPKALAATPRASVTLPPPTAGSAPTLRDAPAAVVSGGIVSAPDVESAPPVDAPVVAADETGLTERFGEPRGMITPTPGLESLEGLAEQAPESVPVEQLEVPAPAGTTEAAASAPPAATPEPLDVAGDTPGALAGPAAPRTIGKPQGELDDVEEPALSDVRAEPAPPDLAHTPDAPHSATAASPRGEAGGEGDNVSLSRDPFQPAIPPADEVATWPTSVAAATEETARTLAQIEEQATEEAERIDGAIRAAGPDTAGDGAAAHAAVTDGAAEEAPVAEETPSPERAQRMGSRPTSARPEPRPAREDQPGGPSRPPGTPGTPGTAASRRSRATKSGRGTPYAASAPGEGEPGTAHQEPRGPGGRKHSGHKRKHSSR